MANRQIYTYFGALTLLFFFTAPEFLLDVPTTILLKNQLHATAPQVSLFRLLTGIPLYVAFLFGITRDIWNPFQMRDRGYFLLFGPLGAAVALWMAFSPVSYWGLVAGTLLIYIASRFVQAAQQGLIALIGQEALMSGRLSTIFCVLGNLSIIAAFLGSGAVVTYLSPKQTFLIAAGVISLFGLFAFWKPAAVFSQAYDSPLARGSTFVGDVRRLIRHKAVYPALLINFLWYFNPGLNTPMQFHLSEHLHAADSVYPIYFATFMAAMIPVTLLYGYLCSRVSARKMLWLGTFVGVPQMIPLLFIRTADMAVPIAAVMGLMGGIGAAVYFDLGVRSCPAGLQGTMMMLTNAMTYITIRGSDYMGASLYASSPENGFLYCVIATTLVYAAILLVIPFIPAHVIDTADGQPNPALDASVIAEIQAG